MPLHPSVTTNTSSLNNFRAREEKYRRQMENELGLFGPTDSDYEYESDDSIPPLKDVHKKLLKEGTQVTPSTPIPKKGLTWEDQNNLNNLQGTILSSSSLRYDPQLRPKILPTDIADMFPNSSLTVDDFRRAIFRPQGRHYKANRDPSRREALMYASHSLTDDEVAKFRLEIESEMGAFGSHETDFEYESDDSIPSLRDVAKRIWKNILRTKKRKQAVQPLRVSAVQVAPVLWPDNSSSDEC